MKTAAAKRETTTVDPVEEEMDRFMEAQAAKAQFLGATLNMSWRLALTVLIPIIAGVKIDQHFHTEPSFTLLGFIIAAVGGSMAVWGTIKQVNADQAAAAGKKTARRVKRVK